MDLEPSPTIFVRRSTVAAALPLLAVLLWPATAHARVTKVVVDPGKSASLASDVGPSAAIRYEPISGVVYGELDPKDRRNSLIQDIDLAPRNARGRVEYAATFTLYKPADLAKSSGILQYEVVNRGASLHPRDFATGDFFLISGWQGDIPFGGKSVFGTPGETIQVPVARHPDGSSISGPVLLRFSNMAPGLNTLPVRVATPYASSGPPPAPVDLDTAHAQLTAVSYEGVDGSSSAPQTIAAADWTWGDCSKTPFPGTPDPQKICLRNGFNPALLYELVYQGKDPKVLGVGLAAMRDVISFFRYESHDDSGWENPLSGHVRASIGIGVSQAGNLVRTFLNLGFNEDESGRRVWDGAMPIIAARQTPVNHRFAVPGGASGLYELGSDGVVWWSDWPDKVRNQPTGGLLHRCTATKTCPRIFDVLGSTEFWVLRASPDFVGTDSKQDIPLPENVRRYYIASTQHGGGRGGFAIAAARPAEPEARKPSTENPIAGISCVLPANPNPMAEILRALLADLKEWVINNSPPPPSSYPTLKNGVLVAANAAAMGFPRIPGVPTPDGVANPLVVYDLGADMRANDLTGFLTRQPPEIRGVIEPFVPRGDADGNEIGGIHTVQQKAALGTYLGWNITAAGFAKGQYCSLTGSFIPFPVTRAQRLASHDVRLSLEERYGTQEGFVCTVKKAAQALVRQRLLLKVDADRIVEQAASSQVLPRSDAAGAESQRIGKLRCATGGDQLRTGP